MPVAEITDTAVERWTQYLHDVNALLNRAFSRKPPGQREILTEIAGRLFLELHSDALIEQFGWAFELEYQDSPFGGELLCEEPPYFHEVQAAAAEQNDAATDAAAAETAKTIKDSFEKYLKKLPDKWQKGLSVLNELLSFVRI
jgi:hypothetical protein